MIIDFYVSYFKQYVLYELPYHKTHEINNELVYDSVKFEYFILNSKRDYGYLIKSENDSFSHFNIRKDSILNTRAYFYFDTLKKEDLFREMTMKKEDKISVGKEKEIHKYIFDHYFYDSAYFYFDKSLKQIKFSFSKSLDSTYDSKLYKMQMFIKHNKSQDTISALKDFYINSFEIIKEPVSEEVKKLFKRYIAFEN